MIYLKFKVAITGESKAKGYDAQIPIESISWGVGRGISTVGGGQNRQLSTPSFSEISISRVTDISSPELFMQACNGKSLESATLTWVVTGGTDKGVEVTQELTLGNPIISSYSQSSGGDRPSESFSINFDSFQFLYNANNGSKGTATATRLYSLADEQKG